MRLFNNRKIDIFFALFLLLWIVYILYSFPSTEGLISADGVTYVHIAKNILLDGDLGWQATWAPPFYSIMMAGTYLLVHNFVLAGYIVNTAMFWLLPVSVYLLASTIFDKKTGITAAVLIAFHPHFFAGYITAEPEITYTALLVFAVAFSWLAYSRNSAIYGMLSGLFFSISYLTRSEGFMIFAFVISTVFFLHIRDKKGLRSLTYVAAMLIVFILVSLPYLVFLKGTYGKWVMSPKSSYVQIWMKWKIYNDNDLGEQGNPELWGLSKNGKLMWQEPKGAGDLISYLVSDPKKSIRVYLHNFLMQLPGRISNSSGQLHFPTVFPIYFAIPALFAFFLPGAKRNFKGTLFLASPFAILLVFPVFTEGWVKYLLPYLPFLVVLASVGITAFAEKIGKSELLKNAIIVIFVAVVVSYDIWAVKGPSRNASANVKYRIESAQEQKKAGEWAQKEFKGTPNYMITWSKLAYYLNGRWTAMPVADYNGMVWYAKKNKADYLVFETSGRGESEEIVRTMGNTLDLEVAGVYDSPKQNYGVVFLRPKR